MHGCGLSLLVTKGKRVTICMNDLFNFISFETEFVDWNVTRVNP